jgi:hypothetical protein
MLRLVLVHPPSPLTRRGKSRRRLDLSIVVPLTSALASLHSSPLQLVIGRARGKNLHNQSHHLDKPEWTVIALEMFVHLPRFMKFILFKRRYDLWDYQEGKNVAYTLDIIQAGDSLSKIAHPYGVSGK